MKVLCVGHLVYDITFKLPNFPLENTKMRVNSHVEGGGGPAGNAAYLLGKWGMFVDICGVVGDDYQGNKIIDEFNNVGVNTKYILKNQDCPTDVAFIMASEISGTRTILSSVMPREHSLIPVGDGYDGILMDGEELLTSQKVLKENPNALSIIDADKYTTNTISLAHKVKILACSKSFAEAFSGQKIDSSDINQLIEIHKLLEDEFKNIVVITLEEAGSFAKINNQYKIIPSIEVKVVDSTGAGDMFHASLLYFLLHNYPLEEAIRLANVAGALTTTKLGNRNSLCSLEDVIKYGGINDII